MKNLLMILCFLASTSVFAQRVTVTGTVTDEGGSPMPGTTIVIKGTTEGTATDANGKYSIEVANRNVSLIFSFVGYVTQETTVGSRTVIDVILEAEITGLDEVIVVGYGTQRKSDITGTVSSLPQERLQMVPNLNVTQAIQGSIPGVFIHTSTSGTDPEQSIMIRGRNSITADNEPLIILDGIPYGGNLTDINPNDIKSIEVLKDASAAAIYGSRGANGVILITSKEGQAGKTVFTYDGKYSVLDVTKTERQLTGPEFYEFKLTRNAAAMTASEEAIYQAGTWVNWTKLALRTGQTQEHNISASGGFGDTKFYFGGGLTDIKGVAKNDDFKRLSTRINVETKILDWVSIGTRTQFTYDDASGVEANFQTALHTNPLGTAYDEFGNYTIFPWPENIIVVNPLGNLLYDNLDKAYQVLTNNYLIVDVPFIKGLSYRLNTGVRFRFTNTATYEGRNTASGIADLGDAGTGNSVNSNTVVENILSYNRDFGNHTVFVTALYSYEGNKRNSNSLDAKNFPNDFLSWYASAQAKIIAPELDFSESALVSQMLRVNYSFASRYLLTLTVRRDGFSGFGSNSKWGVFPSAAFGWNIANENFFPLKDLFNQLKLRVSYGLNGNQAIGAYESLSKYVVANMTAGDETVIGYKPSRLGLDNLGWESSRTINAGLDFGLFKDRLSGNLDWYLTNTYDLLLDRSISVIHGITEFTTDDWLHPAITSNIGETQNTGIEFVLNSRNIVTNKFQWSTTGNISFNKNKIVSLYGLLNEEGQEIDDVSNLWFIGKPIAVNFDYVWDGVWQLGEETEAATYDTQPGFVKLKDADPNGEIDSKDRQIIGQKDPKVLWGLTNTFSYGNFTLSVFMHGLHGRTTRDLLMNDDVQGAEVRYNTRKKNWWTPTNPTNDWVMNRELANQCQGATGRIYASSDYVRLKDVSLGYDLPKSFIGRVGISKLRVFVTGRNLATITKWPGMDPDLVDDNSQRRIPMQKEYVFGLNLGF